MLGGWIPQIEMFKHKSKKTEEEKWASSTCDYSTKGIARKETGIFHIGKGIEILW